MTKLAERSGTRRGKADATLKLNRLFGPPTAGAGEFAGALSVSDARLLAFPVRSLKGVFAWVSCPAVLTRLQRDACLAGCSDLPPVIPPVAPSSLSRRTTARAWSPERTPPARTASKSCWRNSISRGVRAGTGICPGSRRGFPATLLPDHPETRQ